jgi:hypothetical protein
MTLFALLVSSVVYAREPGEKEGAAKMERKAHLVRLLEISEALDLSDEQALKLKARLDQFDQKAHELHQQIQAQVAILRDAARGDGAALAKVDASVRAVKALRDQMRDLDLKLFEQLSQGLDAQHKARLAITMGHLPWRMHDLLHREREEGSEQRK